MSSTKRQKTSSSSSPSAKALSSSSSSPVTIKFNIGGTIYEVSKSLLDLYPNTMLAVAASKRWNQEDDTDDEKEAPPDGPIFIQRNGHRFEFILDYMQDNGAVFLPSDVTLEAFKNDLNYYGFDVTKEEALENVRVGSISAHQTSYEYLKTLEASANEFLTEFEASTNRRLQCTKLALECFRQYKKDRSLHMVLIPYTICYETAATIIGNEDWKTELDRALQKWFQLKLVSIGLAGDFESYIIKFSFLV